MVLMHCTFTQWDLSTYTVWSWYIFSSYVQDKKSATDQLPDRPADSSIHVPPKTLFVRGIIIDMLALHTCLVAISVVYCSNNQRLVIPLLVIKPQGCLIPRIRTQSHWLLLQYTTLTQTQKYIYAIWHQLTFTESYLIKSDGGVLVTEVWQVVDARHRV